MAVALLVSGCGGHRAHTLASSVTTSSTAATTATAPPPGSGRPAITIGDKNFTEQFLLGELYAKALQARGFQVQLNQNIGPTEVTLGALSSGLLDMYPEYLYIWDTQVAGRHAPLGSLARAYRAGQRYARAHGLVLLAPTRFSDTPALLTTGTLARAEDLHTIGDLSRAGANLTFGGPPQFQQDPAGLPALEQAYGFQPAQFQPLATGAQYQALDAGTVQVAEGQTTDGQLATGGYLTLGDPKGVFADGQAVPVVAAKVLSAEGPAFAETVDDVSRLLTTGVMRQLNAAVDLYHQDPATVAQIFLQANGLQAPTS